MNPPYVANPGLTYRIVFDKQFSIPTTKNVEMLVRLPYSVFYDKAQFKFSLANDEQKNNFLYRVVMMDSIRAQGSTSLLTTVVACFRRYKFYDTGPSGAAVAALETRVNALTDQVNAQEQQLDEQKGKLQQQEAVLSEIQNTYLRNWRVQDVFNGDSAGYVGAYRTTNTGTSYVPESEFVRQTGTRTFESLLKQWAVQNYMHDAVYNMGSSADTNPAYITY